MPLSINMELSQCSRVNRVVLGDKMPLKRMIRVCPYAHTSVCLLFIPLELTKHQHCEPFIVKSLLAEKQIGAQTIKMLVGYQPTGWLVVEVVFSLQESVTPIVFIYFYIVSKSLKFKKNILFIYFFRERGKEGKRGGEKHQCMVTSRTPPTGDLAHNPGTCPDWELNWWPFGLQAGTQSTEPYQPGVLFCFFFFNFQT